MDNLNKQSSFYFIHIFFLLIFMLLLTSCSHVSKKDGPPNFYVDETKVPNAVPKKEVLAKYGNMPFYYVFGRRYYTMHSSKHYNEVGIASWYGTKFHALRTSSGERYNMLAMTAAHKTLPLPTYVEVTNLRNHKQVIVKVNDRGPFEGNRLIDLSYVAAKKLGMLGHGTTLVRVKAIDLDTYGKPKLIFAKNKHRFNHETYAWKKAHSQTLFFQVGAFNNKDRAERLKQRLLALLDAPVSITYPGQAGSHLYKVKIGPIKDEAMINKISLRLKNLGIKSNRIYA